MHKILFYNKFISCLYMFRAHVVNYRDKYTEMHGQQNVKSTYMLHQTVPQPT
jgi:hypothetical protein